MADNRPFAKFDTGYMMNPKWWRVRRAMHDAMPNAMHDALKNALRAAREAHAASILYSAQNQTDGLFPVEAIKSICLIEGDLDEAAITALFEVGLWINHPGGMAEVRDYLDHQTSAAEIRAKSEAAKKAADARWGRQATGNAERSATCNAERNAERNAEEKRREEKKTIAHATPDDDPAFLAFWAHYPKKDDRIKAWKAWKGALKLTTAETLTEAAKNYAIEVQGREKKYIKLGATWLNAGSWENQPATPEPASDVERDPYAWMDRRKADRSA